MSKSQVDKIREFNRFYTSIIGLVDRYILHSNYTLPEARILFEINRAQRISASDIMSITQMDKGYLSRLLTKFEKKGLIGRKVSTDDKRVYFNYLTPKGESEFHTLDKASYAQVATIIHQLNSSDQIALSESMNRIMRILSNLKE